ncbi:hypothetical protein NMY22_g18080 [Coprinellus aureogranulatus]|nr:hypothetical protein NMY22_g18080 [Coprinellus aureogranulatus]
MELCQDDAPGEGAPSEIAPTDPAPTTPESSLCLHTNLNASSPNLEPTIYVERPMELCQDNRGSGQHVWRCLPRPLPECLTHPVPARQPDSCSAYIVPYIIRVKRPGPKAKLWEQVIDDWDGKDKIRCPVPLREWKLEWYEGTDQEEEYRLREVIACEFDKCNRDKRLFREKYPAHAEGLEKLANAIDPIPPGLSIPGLRTLGGGWKAAVFQWNKGGRGLVKPLKDYPRRWFSKDQLRVFKERRTIARAYAGCNSNDDEFAKAYPAAAKSNRSIRELLKEISNKDREGNGRSGCGEDLTEIAGENREGSDGHNAMGQDEVVRVDMAPDSV